jgi:hypothetical protein
MRAITEASGTSKSAIGASISNAISEKVKFDEQMAIVMNSLEVIFDKLEEVLEEKLAPEDFEEYRVFRKSIKEMHK